MLLSNVTGAGTRCRRVGRSHGELGSALVEAAIVLPLLLLLIVSILEFGRLFYTKITVESAVRQATRFAVTGNKKEDPMNPGQDLPRPEAIKQYLVEHAPAVDIDPAKIVLDPASGGGPGDIVKVRVEHTFEFVTPLIANFFDNGDYTITYTATMKNEPKFTEKRRT
jgi:hypothetical protein